MYTPQIVGPGRKVLGSTFDVRVHLPLLIEPSEVCDKLHISTTALRRWEIKSVIPFVALGKVRRYRPKAVEEAMRKQRFGPPLPPGLDPEELRERVPAEVICEWLRTSRTTLDCRMNDGLIPYYKIGQTYRFAPDEICFALGIDMEPQSAPDVTGGAP